MKRFLILAVAAGLVLSACASASLPSAGGQRDGDTSPKTVRSNAPAATPEKTAPKARKHPASEPKSCQPLTGGTEGSVAQLVDVRIGTDDGYDRVTFEFASPSDGQYFGLPRYELVPATPPITEDGSGDPVSMDGSRYAVIVFHGASGVDMRRLRGHALLGLRLEQLVMLERERAPEASAGGGRLPPRLSYAPRTHLGTQGPPDIRRAL